MEVMASLTFLRRGDAVWTLVIVATDNFFFFFLFFWESRALGKEGFGVAHTIRRLRDSIRRGGEVVREETTTTGFSIENGIEQR